MEAAHFFIRGSWVKKDMTPFEALKDKTSNEVSLVELRRLLVEVKEKKPGVCVRFRLMGELWAKSFMSIAGVTEKGVVLRDDSANTFVAITNLSDVIQFEIDEPFQSYKPYNHYDVKGSAEF
jgi:hypothetical protein